ncbi:MAG: D-alanyl-D-alanine carboxypeptidase/D-alanyl-D-alanine-endopeptidase [Bdellovibrionales bacterium]|nr:D-alanyl-D-alanine carboxypeptidase/D-alanyl-D-alanine-endopeptidase [Bdellovibrionales bacterium]
MATNIWQLGLSAYLLCFSFFWTVALGTELSGRLNRSLSQSNLNKDELALVVMLHSEGKAEEILSINADQKFIPASVTKILTAAMALEKYPTGHRFVTELVSSKANEGPLLKGDLFLKGGGDPGFVSESMWALVNEFVRTGIKTIEGDLVVDDSRFDKERFDSGRDPERVDRAYDAPIGAMSFNWNSVNIYVRPGKKEGDKPFVYADPENEYIRLINEAHTSGPRSKKDLQVSRKPNGTKSDTIVVSGKIPVGGDEVVIYKGVLQPEIWSAFNLRSFLLSRGISVKGQVREGKIPSTGVVRLAKIESKPIGAIVTDMMKFSNNYVAEMLTKNLAAELVGIPGTMENGIKVLSDYMNEKGFKSDSFSLTSPSGLSRRNRVTAHQLLRILEDLRKNFTVFPEFVSSLPILGVDGTLKSRMKGSEAKGWVRAKTGMLTGTIGLSGYAGRADGGVITFVFLFNGSANKMDVAKRFFDSLIMELFL